MLSRRPCSSSIKSIFIIFYDHTDLFLATATESVYDLLIDYNQLLNQLSQKSNKSVIQFWRYSVPLIYLIKMIACCRCDSDIYGKKNSAIKKINKISGYVVDICFTFSFVCS